MGKPVAFILGSALCLHDDFKAALSSFQPSSIIAVNEAGRDYEGVLDHWVSMHPPLLIKWIEERRDWDVPLFTGTVWTPRHITLPKGLIASRAESWGGSSGLLAVTVALGLGFEKIILCGVPMERLGAHYFNKDRPWNDAGIYKASWKRNLDKIAPTVRSMSGWTKELLGAPSLEWVNASIPVK